MALPPWTLLPVVLAGILAVLWPVRFPPGRRLFWQRALTVALVPVLLVAGQAVLERGAEALPWVAGFLTVSAAYLFSLVRLDAGGRGGGRASLAVLLLAVAGTTASLIVLSHALGFIVSVTTLLFLGASLPLRPLQWVALPAVALTVWLISVTAARPPDLAEALSNGAGLLMTVVFGYMLRRSVRLGEELREANAALARHAAQAEELAMLRERTRLARELHDTLGHALTTITVQLEAGERLLEKNPQKARTLFERSRDLSRSATAELRASLGELRRGEMGSLGDELRALARSGDPDGPQVNVQVAEVSLSPQQEHALARVAREALHNARRHAGAARVCLDLRRTPEGLVLQVTDDGLGFDPSLVPAGHYGLSGMRERLALLGGHLTIDSQPGQGTRLTATLPLRAPTPEVQPT